MLSLTSVLASEDDIGDVADEFVLPYLRVHPMTVTVYVAAGIRTGVAGSQASRLDHSATAWTQLGNGNVATLLRRSCAAVSTQLGRSSDAARQHCGNTLAPHFSWFTYLVYLVPVGRVSAGKPRPTANCGKSF